VPTAAAAGSATLVVRPENLTIQAAGGTGWRGIVGFSTPLGPTVEYEVNCGWDEPLRAVVPRGFGSGLIPAGTAVTVSLIDEAAAIVLPGQTGRNHDS
jgi:TOBE domain